jgi:hypothetical protein
MHADNTTHEPPLTVVMVDLQTSPQTCIKLSGPAPTPKEVTPWRL